MFAFPVSWALRCLRWCFFSYYRKPRLPRSLETRGKLAERRAEMALKHFKRVWRGRNRKLYFDNFVLVGRADFVTESEVIEVKAKITPDFLLSNLAQLNVYMLMEGKTKGVLLSQDSIVTADRSDFLLRQSFLHFENLAECLKEGTIPEGDRIFCRSCQFREFCF